MGILTIVLGLITCHIGAIIIGWIHAKKWDNKKVMMIWTICLAIIAVVQIAVAVAIGGAAATMDPSQFQ